MTSTLSILPSAAALSAMSSIGFVSTLRRVETEVLAALRAVSVSAASARLGTPEKRGDWYFTVYTVTLEVGGKKFTLQGSIAGDGWDDASHIESLPHAWADVFALRIASGDGADEEVGYSLDLRDLLGISEEEQSLVCCSFPMENILEEIAKRINDAIKGAVYS